MPPGQYYKLPDMESVGAGLNVYYSFDSSHYSLAAALEQSVIPTESGGSWVILLTSRYQRIRNSARILPAELGAPFGSDQALDTAEMHNVAVGPGYGYYWMPQPFFVAPFLGLTGGYQRTTWTTGAAPLVNSSGTLNVHLRIALGLNQPEYFITLNANADRYVQVTDQLDIGNRVISATLSAGLRF